MKRIIICLDGTWKAADQKGRATNVVKLMRAIAPRDAEGNEQIVYYDKGVGTSGSKLERVLAGATGRGLDDAVKDAYLFLGNNHEPGDEIHIFGFSRGAFTARSLAGFLAAAGLLDRNGLRHLKDAWAYYRARDRTGSTHPGGKQVDIACIGVWDTVGALGIPVRWFSPARWHKKRHYAFHDTSIGERIRCALHAIAIDEKRGPFAPTLWQRRVDQPPSDQIVEQTWFAGCHSDVGGGVPDPSLSDIPLEWMIERTRQHTALTFRTDWRDQYRDDPERPHIIEGDALGPLHESRSLPYALSWLLPFERVIGTRNAWTRRFLASHNRPREGHRFVNESLHESVALRYAQRPRGARAAYEPVNVAAAKDHVPVAPWPRDQEAERETPIARPQDAPLVRR